MTKINTNNFICEGCGYKKRHTNDFKQFIYKGLNIDIQYTVCNKIILCISTEKYRNIGVDDAFILEFLINSSMYADNVKKM